MTILRIRRLTSLSLIAAVWGSFAALLIGCTAAQKQRAVVDGELFCARATPAGPLVVALANAAGAPIIVTDMTAQAVASACAVIDAIPVTPPADPSAAPVVAVKAA